VIASYLLSLREGLEAALIIGIVLGMLGKLNRRDLPPLVWFGAISAAAISLAVAVLLQYFGATLEGGSEELFEGLTMLLAAGILTWMIFWMRRQSRSIQSDLEEDVRRASKSGSRSALFLVAFLAVLREGVELALFLTATSLTTGTQGTLIGGLLGLGTAAVLGWALFASTIRLDLKKFFQVTGFLLILFAAGLVAHGVHELNEAGIIPTIIDHVWDVNWLLDDSSFIGEVMKSLFGYNGNPSLTEVLAFISYFAAISVSLLLNRPRQVVKQEV